MRYQVLQLHSKDFFSVPTSGKIWHKRAMFIAFNVTYKKKLKHFIKMFLYNHYNNLIWFQLSSFLFLQQLSFHHILFIIFHHLLFVTFILQWTRKKVGFLHGATSQLLIQPLFNTDYFFQRETQYWSACVGDDFLNSHRVYCSFCILEHSDSDHLGSPRITLRNKRNILCI